jgi:MFS family permease
MNLKKTILYSSVFALQGLSNAVIPVLPELAGQDSSGSLASNLLFSGYFIGALLALVPFGILADRIGNGKVAGFGILLTFASGLVISFSGNIWVLGITRFAEGIACGAFFPAAFSMLSEWEDGKRSLGEFNFLLNAGLAAGVLFSGILAGFGIKTAIHMFTFLIGLSSILLLSQMRELISSGRKEKIQSLEDYKKIHEKRALQSEFGNYFKKAWETTFKTDFGKIWGISVLLYGTTGLLTANYADYSAEFLSKPELGLAISGSYIAAMFSSLLAGRVEASSKNIIRTGIALAVAGILLSTNSPILAFLLIGAGGGAAIVGLITAVAKVSSSGFAMGLFNTGIYAGLGLGPVFGSFFIGTFGYETVFLGSALILFAVLFIKLE